MGLSSIRYSYPVLSDSDVPLKLWSNVPTHTGKYEHALDFVIPNPLINPVPIYAPASGIVIAIQDGYDTVGITKDFEEYGNYVTIELLHRQKEFFEIIHIAKGSCRFGVGDLVNERDVLAQTGVNGRMYNFEHCHFMVGRWTLPGRMNFESLSIRFSVNS